VTTKTKKGPKPTSTDPETAAPEDQIQDPGPTPQERAIACGAEVKQVLDKHGCRLQPILANPEPIGNDGAKAVMRADVVILPNRSNG